MLGDCPVDNVVAAAFFWEPATMRIAVVEGRAAMAPSTGAAIYRDICESWGERHLVDFDGSERLGELCERVASETSPLEAILSGPAGEWNAEFFGWPKPYPDVSALADPRNEIEAATDRLHAPDFEVLSADERAELRNLAKSARAHATAQESR